MEVSVIIPTYHSSHDIPNIVNCLKNQTFTDFEAIFVNDGDRSQDQALAAAQAADSRIKVISLPENVGVSAARNIGLEAAQGTFVSMVDVDDIFGPQFLQTMYGAITAEEGVDLAVSGLSSMNVRAKKTTFVTFDLGGEEMKVLPKAEAYRLMYRSDLRYYPHNKMYRLSVIRDNGIRWERYQSHEDMLFNLLYYEEASKIALLRDSGYIYCMAEKRSLSSIYDHNLQESRRLAMGRELHLMLELGFSEQEMAEHRSSLLVHLAFLIAINGFKHNSPLSFKEQRAVIRSGIIDCPEVAEAVISSTEPGGLPYSLLRFFTRIKRAKGLAISFAIMMKAKYTFTGLYSRIRTIFFK